MKRFFKLTVLFVFILFVASLLLDVIFTTIISQSSERNKVENVLHSFGKKYDVVILGTSRANNHFVTDLFEKKGLKSFNYGISGSHLFETSLLLKLMMANKFQIKNLILEADLSICNEKRDEGTTARFMPYIHTNSIIKEHYKNEIDFKQLYYVPFYRYIKFDAKIGFREVYEVLAEKPTNTLYNKGYYPLISDKKGSMKNDISTLKVIRNKYYEEIKKICKQNNINLIVVMTPMCKNTKGLDYFDNVKKQYPEINNFENTVTDDRYFASCGHLNNEGAIIYTNHIINTFFK
ncbi:hypothetical protein [Flavobacterium sp.]|uniref:hypothetical protein n=1 Tax=Flavobacterium sp. TaxID=239 RepID=UPI001B599081|nr:hypothetical protein [Flavobacterium sp.]MBP6127629.1 hypothetical protein [Flavobacterium sp.]